MSKCYGCIIIREKYIFQHRLKLKNISGNVLNQMNNLFCTGRVALTSGISKGHKGGRQAVSES